MAACVSKRRIGTIEESLRDDARLLSHLYKRVKVNGPSCFDDVEMAQNVAYDVPSISTNINEVLSNECILMVFSHLQPKELCTSVNLVCKSWYMVSSENTLWKDLVLQRWQIDFKPKKNISWKEFYAQQELRRRKRNRKLRFIFSSLNRGEFIITDKFISSHGFGAQQQLQGGVEEVAPQEQPHEAEHHHAQKLRDIFYTANFDQRGVEITEQEGGKITTKISYLFENGFPQDLLRSCIPSPVRRIDGKIFQSKLKKITKDLDEKRAQVFIPINCSRCSERLFTSATIYFCTQCSGNSPFVLCEPCNPFSHEHEHPLRKMQQGESA